jgi:hypothetical protein
MKVNFALLGSKDLLVSFERLSFKYFFKNAYDKNAA